MIFQTVGDARPYPDHGRTTPRDWADIPPRAALVQKRPVLHARVLELPD